LIAYLQRVGTDLFKTEEPAKPATPAPEATAPEAAASEVTASTNVTSGSQQVGDGAQ
jgi:hypothetical protein